VHSLSQSIQNETLREESRKFCQQEMQHANQHKNFLQVLTKQGFVFNILTELTKNLTNFNLWFFSKKTNLAIVAGYEHFTALFAKIALENDIFKNSNSEIKALFEWHAAEEIEHKSVAFELLQEIDNNYLLRSSGIIIAAMTLWLLI